MRISLSKKLFIFIFISLAFIILPLFFIARASLNQFGSYAYDVNEKQIKKSSRFYMASIAEEQAKTYDEIFEKISIASSLMGHQLTQIYQQMDGRSQSSPHRVVPLTKKPENGIFYTPHYEPVIMAFWGDDKISPEIEIELGALSQFMPTLMEAKEKIHESLAVHIITISGIGCYYTTNSLAKTACYHLPPVSEFDLRQGEPVTLFTRSNTRYFDTKWTGIYKDDVIDGLVITASTPIYDSNNQFKGITGIDISVDYITKNLIGNTARVDGIDESILFSFLLNQDGKIIAFPREFLPLFGLDVDFRQFKNSSDIFNYKLSDSKISAIRNTENLITPTRHGIIDVQIEKENYLMAVGSLNSVGWHLVCVAKESDLTASLEKTGKALEKSLTTIWRDFLGYFGFILLALIFFVLTAIRVFIMPIRDFIDATKKVSKGDFTLTLDTNRTDEIGQLARSFNLMVKKLKLSENIEREHANELENRILSRTAELEKTNTQLNQIKDSLEKIITKRTVQLRKLNEHLVYSEETARKAIASDLHDSVTQSLAMCISKLKDIQESDTQMDKENLLPVQEYIEQAVREIRSLIYQLSPPVLDDFDIDIALGFLIEETNIKHCSKLSYVNNIESSIKMEQSVKVTLYRAVSELIINIIKHAKTKTGRVSIAYTKGIIKLTVTDQGIGFDVKSIINIETSGFGLNSIAERMENFGGKIEVESTPGTGTYICLTLPVQMHKKFINEND
ncbi:MAG: HAMP domain-containing protein [Desulfobacula sp.]|nr:HAMP domain-containing protein [Desulfobacula sp.]